MAMKKRPSSPKKPANDDTVIYKVMIALGMLCILLLSTQLISRRYVVVDTMFTVQAALGWAALAFGILAAALLVLWLVCRRSAVFWRAAGLPLFLLALVLALSCCFLYYTWVTYISLLYFAYIAAAVLYMIALLYQHEFFLLSLLNSCAGLVFYCLNRLYDSGVVFSARALILTIGLAAAILLAAGVMFFAGRKGGVLRLFGKERRLFAAGASPLPLYIACAVWAVCLIASSLLGSAFAYYCIFAVAAFELAAAVYYTVKLA